MSEHTPGPWQVALRTDGHRYVEDSEGATVCDIPDGFLLTEADYPSENARLIAAAPELLAALRHILLDIQHPKDFASDGDQLDCISNRARAAIAKATNG